VQDLVLRGTMRTSLFASTALSYCMIWCKKQAPQSVLVNQQARRQDLAAGGPKTRSRGQKPEGGATFSKYSNGCMQQPVGQTWNWGHRFQVGGGHYWPPVGDGPVNQVYTPGSIRISRDALPWWTLHGWIRCFLLKISVEFVFAPQHETSCDSEITTKEDLDYWRNVIEETHLEVYR